MSALVSGWVWACAPVKSGELVVLLALADNAHDDGGGAYPSLAHLAKKSRLKRRQVINCLNALEEKGLIERRGTTRGGVTVWAVLMSANFAPLVFDDDGGEVDCTPGGNGVHPEPSIEPSEPLSQDNACEERTAGGLRLIDEASSERSHAGARARRKIRRKGRVVPEETLQLAERLLETFNQEMGTKLKPWSGRSEPSTHLQRIYGALMDRDGEATEAEWHRAVRNTVANPPSWVEGRLAIGDVFGPKAADRALANTGAPPIGIAAGNPITRPGRVDWGAVAETLEAQGL